MASSQTLSLVVQAIDRASGVLGKIGGSIRGLGKEANDAIAKTENLSNAIAWGMAKSQLAISGVTQAYNKMTSAFQEASAIELENLSTAGGLEEMLGGFDKAAQFVDSINGSLAKSAAALPGATKDYTAIARTISDDVAAAFKGADGKIADKDKFQKTLESISTSYAAMAATNNISAGNMQLFMMKALGGTASQAELMQIDALQKNPQLRTKLEEAMKAEGVKALKDLSTEKRIKLIEEVGRKVITPEFLKRSQDTVEGMWQSFVSGLFDPMGGVFGIMRDLDPNVDGQQTAFNEIKKTMALLIGSDGMLAQVGGIMEALGLSVDPMRVLQQATQRLNQFLTRVSQILGAFKGDISAGAIPINPQSIAREIGYRLGGLFNQGMKVLAGIDINSALGAAGAAIAGGLNFLSTAIISLLSSVDYGQVAGFVGSLVTGIFKGLLLLLGGLNWQSYALIGGGLLVAAIVPGIVTFAGGLVATFLAGTVGLPVLLVAAAAFAIAALVKSIIDNWTSISAMIQEAFTGIGQAFGAVMQVVIGVVTLNGGMIRDGLTSLFEAVSGWIQSAKDTWATLTGGQTSGEQKADAAYDAANARFEAAKAAKATKTAPIAAPGAAPAGPTVPAAFNGHIPNAAMGLIPSAFSGKVGNYAGGLVGAATAEAKAMPTGAQVVVANSKEFILKPTGKTSGGGASITNYFTIVTSDARAAAQEVMAILQQQFEAELATQL
jgi:hypothetical protein